MLEEKDVQKLKEELTTKEDLERFATKEDLETTSAKLLAEILSNREDINKLKEEVKGLREAVESLIVSVDKLVKAVSDLRTEYAVITLKVDRHEKWIQKLAEKLGVKLEY